MRMLFSCLVDADRLATECFKRKVEPDLANEPERGWQGNLEGLRQLLNNRLEEFKPLCSDVAWLRADVLHAAREAANEPLGLFTMTVPTGGGKTLSSLAFALDHAIRHGMRRVVHVAPFTSIVEQTADVFRDILGKDAVLEHHSAFDESKVDHNDGEDDADGAKKLRLATENWDRPVVVTTAVEFFESLFSNQTSRCRKLHNLAGAVVILDEAQTLPLKVLRPCLAALSALSKGYNSSVVLCTATQPAVRDKDGFQAPEALKDVREIAPDPDNLYRRLKRVSVKNRGELNDHDLAKELLAEERVLCIVNNRCHARDLFSQIRQDERAWHLTTNMCADHRRKTLHTIREALKSGPSVRVRVIATSLVEAGVDIDFPCVWRAVAGIDSIAQAAGRCNREGRLGPEKGKVFLFHPQDNQDHLPPPELKQFAETAEHVPEKYSDPLSLDALKAYFKELLWSRGCEDLDSLKVGKKGRWRGIIKAIEGSRGDLTQYAFADIAHAFKLIDDRTLPLIIPGGRDGICHGAPEEVMKDLHGLPYPGAIARRLQPYLVQVPIRVRNDLIAKGAAETVRESEFNDRFVVLRNLQLYDECTGLNWDEPELLGADSTVF